jgi:4-alpha-glucanotransferase
MKTKTVKKENTIKLSFHLKYQTTYGQSIWIYGNHPLLGGGEVDNAIPLVYLNETYWVLHLNFPITDNADKIIYHYLIKDDKAGEILEWGNDKILDLASFTNDELVLIDTWNFAGQIENVFYTEPFTSTLLKDNVESALAKKITKTKTHLFKVKAPLLKKGQTLCMIGESAVLGNWDIGKSLPLTKIKDADYKDPVYFELALDLKETSFPLIYKYGIYDHKKKLFISYESGNNRVVYEPASKNKLVICNDGFAALNSTEWKGAGVAIPVFSLRSNEGCGVGEFSDIKLLVDWSKKIGLKLIQLLPVNDTTATHTWMDSYPYAAISAFALHPLLIRIDEMILPKQESLIESYILEKEKLNALKAVDYESVMKLKWKILRTLFDKNGKHELASASFTEFFKDNAHWLVSYSAFSYLRELHGTVNFNAWPTHSKYNELAIQKLADPKSSTYSEISFYYYVQYHLHLQLKSATRYAHENGIIVKGDIPIGVYRFGADAWQHSDLFHMDRQAGAPPDDFAVKGQNWGFPTYNWEKMAATNYSWWKLRFEQMRFYFDAFRIDHILGFFRIWSIPMHAVDGIMGRFVPAIPLSLHEFHSKGISLDADRFTQPFINETNLFQLFGYDNEYVKNNYLEALGDGQYTFLPAFKTQVEIVHHFKTLPNDDWQNKIQDGLLFLLTNVILFEDEKPGLYHFRFNIEGTSSFQSLDEKTKKILRELYVDYFFVKQNNAWEKEALEKLPNLKRATNMLICGEDLGLVPACLPEVMKQLGILSLEVQRMPKANNSLFFNPKDAPYLSVVTPSSHDTSTLRGWWEEDPSKTQQFFKEQLEQSGEAPKFCEPWINKAILIQHLYSPAMWSVFQLQDYLGVDAKLRRQDPHAERINEPANPKHYWRYRMHLSLETLIASKSFNEDWAIAIKESGR